MRRVIVLAASVVAVVSGCGGSAGGSAGSPPMSSVGRLDIPRVSEPLDVGRFATDPCALVGVSDRSALGLPDTSYDATENPAGCDLQVDGDRPDPVDYLRIVVTPDGGLRDVYAQCEVVKSIDCSRWSLDSIDGYPVLRANGPEAEHGVCRLYLGVADDAQIAIVDVRAAAADGPDCERADRSAADILATLR